MHSSFAFQVLQMDKVSGATECLHSGMTEPTIWQRSCTSVQGECRDRACTGMAEPHTWAT